MFLDNHQGDKLQCENYGKGKTMNLLLLVPAQVTVSKQLFYHKVLASGANNPKYWLDNVDFVYMNLPWRSDW